MNSLCDLEIELHQFDARSNENRLDELLHNSFIEFGRSGRCYNKKDIIKLLLTETEPSVKPWSQDYQISELAEGVAQVTYKSAHVNNEGDLSRHTLRSSIWQRVDGKWQVRFHQGTLTKAFTKK